MYPVEGTVNEIYNNSSQSQTKSNTKKVQFHSTLSRVKISMQKFQNILQVIAQKSANM